MENLDSMSKAHVLHCYAHPEQLDPPMNYEQWNGTSISIITFLAKYFMQNDPHHEICTKLKNCLEGYMTWYKSQNDNPKFWQEQIDPALMTKADNIVDKKN